MLSSKWVKKLQICCSRQHRKQIPLAHWIWNISHNQNPGSSQDLSHMLYIPGNTEYVLFYNTQKGISLGEDYLQWTTSQCFAKKLPSSLSYHNCKRFIIAMKQCTKGWNESTAVWKRNWGSTATYKFKTTFPWQLTQTLLCFGPQVLTFSIFSLELIRWIHPLCMQIDQIHIIQLSLRTWLAHYFITSLKM